MSTDLLTAEGLRSAQGGVFAYVSPSRLNCWIKCPRAFAFRYLEGIKTPTTPSLFLGTAVHAAYVDLAVMRTLPPTGNSVGLSA
jgi:hypothetical protein